MILLAAREITRQYDAAMVLDRVSFEVRRGEKIGLVGPNGCGKTTLLQILAGLDEPDTGEVETHSSVAVDLLQQEADFPPERTLLDEAKQGLADLYRLQREAHDLADEIAVETDAALLNQLQRRYDRIQQDLHRLGAYNIDHRVDEVLVGLGFRTEDYDRPLKEFSGGEQSRVFLARLLLRAPAVMLLDEPTNHLDLETTEWLESYLARSDASLILVSHDRYFLDRVTNRMLELSNGSIADYRGNFSAYWSQRQERNKVLRRTYEKQQESIAKTEDFIRRNKYGQKHAQAADREKKLQRIEQVERPQDVSTPAMKFSAASRTGDWVIDAVGVSKGFGSPLFSDFNLRVNRGDRIGIFGHNGSGKTTLLRTLTGELEPDSGTVRLGTRVKIGYFDQQLAGVDPQLDAVEAIRPPENPFIGPGPLRSLLARFGVRGDMVFQKVGSLSGGEKSKVALAKIAAQDVNLMVLDEPTNHLDLWARDSLENALEDFDGTLVFVSHDRSLLDRLATHVIVLEPGRWRFYDGNYSDYVRFVKNQAREGDSRASGANAEAATQPPRTPSRKQELKQSPRKYPYRKVDDLEAEIAEVEQRVQQLQDELADPEVHRNGQRARHAKQAFEETRAKLEDLYAHWEEANELN